MVRINGDGRYYCDSVNDMVGIRAEKGECAVVHGDIWRFTGESWENIGRVWEENKRVEYFTNLPVMVCGDCFYKLGNAFYEAWERGVKYIWLSGRHISGEPEIGDILEVRGRRWVVKGRELEYLSNYERYLLERVIEKPKPLGVRRAN